MIEDNGEYTQGYSLASEWHDSAFFLFHAATVAAAAAWLISCDFHICRPSLFLSFGVGIFFCFSHFQSAYFDG